MEVLRSPMRIEADACVPFSKSKRNAAPPPFVRSDPVPSKLCPAKVFSVALFRPSVDFQGGQKGTSFKTSLSIAGA